MVPDINSGEGKMTLVLVEAGSGEAVKVSGGCCFEVSLLSSAEEGKEVWRGTILLSIHVNSVMQLRASI